MNREQLWEVAGVVADRIADLLEAPVHITDEQGEVLASVPFGGDNARGSDEFDSLEEPYLSTRLTLQHHPFQVIVGPPRATQPVPRSVALSLVELVVRQHSSRTEMEKQFEARNAFLSNLLVGGTTDTRAALRQAKSLDIDLQRERTLLLIDASAYILGPAAAQHGPTGERTRWRTQSVLSAINGFFRVAGDAVSGYLGNGAIAVLKGCGRGDLLPWVDRHQEGRLTETRVMHRALEMACSSLLTYLASEIGANFPVAIGRHYPGVEGLVASYSDAAVALQVAKNIHIRTNPVAIQQLGLDLFLWSRDFDMKRRFAEQLLAPIRQNAELFQTLKLFFEENFSPAAAAERLHLHRNSLYYRLEKITDLVGLDPRIAGEALQLQLAMLVLDEPVEALEARRGLALVE